MTDAVQSRIVYDSKGGKNEEWVLAAITVSRMPIAGLYGRTVSLQSTFVENILGFMVPQGEMEKNSALFAAIAGSFRVSPVYGRRPGMCS